MLATVTIGGAAFVAALLTLFSGFGLGTLLMPVVAVFFPVATAVALTAVVHLLGNLFKLVLVWRHIHGGVVLRFGLPAVLATIPGAWLLTHLAVLPAWHNYTVMGLAAEVTPVKLAVGMLLIVFATAEAAPQLKKLHIPPRYLPWGGALSGFFGGLSGHQGAFRSVFLLHAGLDKHAFVATNAALAAFVDVVRLAVYGVQMTALLAALDSGLLTTTTLAACAGAAAGWVGLKKVTIGAIQKLIAGLLYLLGVLLVVGLI
jgi:uncharacterized membrane protein YfcA